MGGGVYCKTFSLVRHDESIFSHENHQQIKKRTMNRKSEKGNEDATKKILKWMMQVEPRPVRLSVKL